MNPSRILIPLLLVLGLGAAAYWFLMRPTDDVVTPTPDPGVTQTAVETPPEPVDPGPTVSQGNVNDAPEQGPGDDPVTRQRVEADNTNSDAPQGVKGRILLPSGGPAANVPIYLIESMMNDPIKVFILTKAGKSPPPVSSGQTAADGTFALGVREPGKSFDLRIASDYHPELTRQGIKPAADDWYDTGDLTLETGRQVTGRVVDEITKGPVADATVYLVESNQAHTMLPTPGRERGIIAITDNTGAFRFDNAPQKGNVNLLAEAPGFAAGRKDNANVAELDNVTIEISRGRPIAGVVVNIEGEPIPGATVVAQGLSQKTPQTEKTTTDRTGVFQFPSLRDGPYTLVANATAFGEAKTPPVMAGDVEAKVVMVQRPWVKLKVLGAHGKGIRNYNVSLKRYFPNNPLGIGNVPEFRDRRVNPSDYPAKFGREWAVIHGVPNGEYVFQIKERGHAKSLSEPFTVREGAEPVEVVAQLTMGASIVGRVVDDQGVPVRGAIVNTDMNNAFQGSGGIFDLFKSMIPERHSKSSTRTGGDGQFRMTKLAFADYMVRVSHADFCEGRQLDITLSEEGQVVDVGTIQLMKGTIVQGYTTVAGQAAGQVKVTITVPQEQQAQALRNNAGKDGGGNAQAATSTMAQMFSANVISQNDGSFRMLKRVPPGTYKITASRNAGDNNPFAILLDMRETEQTITLRPGEDVRKINFDLPSR